MTNKISHALETQRICLRESARHQNMRVLEAQLQTVLAPKIHISLIQHHNALLCTAKLVQSSDRVPPPARRVWCRYKSQCRAKVPPLFPLKLGNRGQVKIRFERN